MATALGTQYAGLLGEVDLFRDLDRVALAKLAAHLESEELQAGSVLCRFGEPGDALYLVTRGHLGVLLPTDSGPVRLNTCAAGETIGEMALLSDAPRSATVVADEDAEVLRLDKSRFLDLVYQEPRVSLAITRVLMERLRTADAARLGSETRPDSLKVVASAPAPITQSVRRARWRPGRRGLGAALALALLSLGWLFPAPSGLGTPGWHALASLLGFVPLLAFGVLPEGPLALLLASIWVVGGVATPRVALGGFASSTWVLVASTCAIGTAIASSGLLYRLALCVVAHTPGGFVGRVFGLGLAGLVSSAAIPDGVVRTSLLAPAVTEIADAVGYENQSRPAAGLGLATLAGFGQMLGPFMTSSSSGLLALALLPEASRQSVTWGGWALRAAPSTAILLLGMLGFIAWWYRPRRVNSLDIATLGLQRKLLGPLTRQERITALVSVGLVLGFVLQPPHGIDPAWIAVLALAVLGATRALGPNSLREVNWNFMLLLGVLMGMTDVFSGSGLDRWFGGIASGLVGSFGGTPILFVAATGLVCLGLSFVLRLQAAIGVLIVTLGPAAQAIGIDPWVVALVVLVTYNNLLFVYQNSMYQALLSATSGRLFAHAQTRPLALAYPLVALAAVMASVPWWHWLGLL